MWPFSALMGTSKDMFTAKELKVGKRYKVPTHRAKCVIVFDKS